MTMSSVKSVIESRHRRMFPSSLNVRMMTENWFTSLPRRSNPRRKSDQVRPKRRKDVTQDFKHFTCKMPSPRIKHVARQNLLNPKTVFFHEANKRPAGVKMIMVGRIDKQRGLPEQNPQPVHGIRQIGRRHHQRPSF